MPRGDLPDVNIVLGGMRLPLAAQTDLRSVTVQEDLDAMSMFSLDLYNWDQDHLEVTWSDSRLFAIGTEVEIQMGYLDNLHKVLLAEVTSLEPAFTSDDMPTLTVRGYDHRHRLTRGRKTRTFTKMKDSAIAGQLAREAGMRAMVKDTRTALEYVIQSNQTDWEFLQRRAHSLGYEVYVRDKTLYFRPPPTDASPDLTLSMGENIIEFTPRMSSLGQIGEVRVRGWDVKKKEAIVAAASAGIEAVMGGQLSGPKAANKAFGRSSTSTVDTPLRTKAEADAIARGRFLATALSYVRGDLVVHGNARLHAGMVVNVAGAGRTFSGPYYVTSARHELTADLGYRTTLTVQRTAT